MKKGKVISINANNKGDELHMSTLLAKRTNKEVEERVNERMRAFDKIQELRNIGSYKEPSFKNNKVELSYEERIAAFNRTLETFFG